MSNPLSLSRRHWLAALPAVATAAGQLCQAAEKPRIRIGQIGTKHAHASGKLEAILKFPETFEFVGIVEPDAERRVAMADRAPYRHVRWMTESELLSTSGLQAVAVETDIPNLVPTAVRCLNAGMHIHLDKPAGESLEACRAMHEIATDRALTIQMGYMLRYNPAFQFADRIVRAGWLGEITEINGMMGKYMNDSGRSELATISGGGMFELACHLIDQVVSLLGAPGRVTSHLRRTFPEKDSFADNQLAVFDYPKAIATIRCNHIDPMGGARRQFSITGTEGTFEIRPLEPTPRGRLGLDRPRGEFEKGYQDVTFERPSGRYDAEFLELASVVRGEKELRWDAEHDVATHEAVLLRQRNALTDDKAFEYHWVHRASIMSTRFHLTADEFDRMVACGAFDHLNRKIELIRGELREINPAGPLHDDLIMFLTGWSARSTSADQISVTAQTGLDLTSLNSRPEPDLLWVRAGRYQQKHPSAEDVQLAIEVSHSSLNYDLREKAGLYAEAGIAEYWLVDAGGACVHVFRSPQSKAFTDHSIAGRGDRISPLAAPDAVLDVNALFG